MNADLVEKTERYGEMLSSAMEIVEIAPRKDPPLGSAAEECIEMANSYLEDGKIFLENGDYVNSLAAFSYGYGWVDAGVRFGLLIAPGDTDLFSV